jgi:hypothetical protein
MAWIYFLLIVGCGVFFYQLRSRHRIAYGSCEILFSLVLAYLVCFPAQGSGTFIVGDDYVPPPFVSELAVQLVAIFASVYAFVRGCDNIVTGLRNPHDL